MEYTVNTKDIDHGRWKYKIQEESEFLNKLACGL